MKLQPKKSLGQHFLNSKKVLEQIIAAAHIQSGETILEIGPGTGILTDALLATGARVIAVEKDARAIDPLKDKFASEITLGGLKIIHDDILAGDHTSYFTPNTSYAVVANIPYYITGAILEKFLEHEPRPDRMILLVQKEVAERIVARDGKESILSISVKIFGNPRIIAKVPRGAFTPAPTVDSAILAIENISDTHFLKKDLKIRVFFDILRAGFAHKRKFLKRNLEIIASSQILEKTWESLKLSEKIRAEDITPDQWSSIVHTIAKTH